MLYELDSSQSQVHCKSVTELLDINITQEDSSQAVGKALQNLWYAMHGKQILIKS